MSPDDASFVGWVAATTTPLLDKEWARLEEIVFSSPDTPLRNRAIAAVGCTARERTASVDQLLRIWLQTEEDEESVFGGTSAFWKILPAAQVADVVLRQMDREGPMDRFVGVSLLTALPTALAQPIAAAAAADEPDLFLRTVLQKLAT